MTEKLVTPSGDSATPAYALELWQRVSTPLRVLIDQPQDRRLRNREELHEWIFEESPYRDEIADAFLSATAHVIMLVCMALNGHVNPDPVVRGLAERDPGAVGIITLILQEFDDRISSGDLADEFGDTIELSPPLWEEFFTTELVLTSTVLFHSSITEAER